MTLIEAGFPFTEAQTLALKGITTVDELKAYMSGTPDVADQFGRVVAIAITQFLESKEPN
jgi:hypothetical protein